MGTSGEDFSTAQVAILWITGGLAVVLSLVGSSLIILSICQRGRRGIQENTLFQLLIGLSICDIVYSGAVFLAPLFVPEETGAAFAFGNQATCSASAFFSMFSSTASTFYNTFISMHFWRTVQTTRRIQKREWCFQLTCHGSSIFISLLIATAGLVIDGYALHPFLWICYTHGETGRRLGQIRILIVAILTIASMYFVGSLVYTVRLSLKKSSKYLQRAMSKTFADTPSSGMDNEKALGRRDSTTGRMPFCHTNATSMSHNVSHPSQDGADNNTDLSTPHEAKKAVNASGKEQQPPLAQKSSNRRLPSFRRTFSRDSTTTTTTTNNPQQQENHQSKEVATQAVWYMVAYLNTVLPAVIGTIVMNATDAEGRESEPQFYILHLYIFFFSTLQGALNFAVFIRPRYNAWKAHYDREHQQQLSNNLPTIQDKRNAIPSIFVILYNAVLEEVPKRRNRRLMPVSGGSHLSGISCGAPEKISSSSTRVSFAFDGSEQWTRDVEQPCADPSPSPQSLDESEPSADKVQPMESTSSASSVADFLKSEQPRINQNRAPCGSVDEADGCIGSVQQQEQDADVATERT